MTRIVLLSRTDVRTLVVQVRPRRSELLGSKCGDSISIEAEQLAERLFIVLARLSIIEDVGQVPRVTAAPPSHAFASCSSVRQFPHALPGPS